MKKAGSKHIAVSPTGVGTFAAHIIDQNGDYLSTPAYGADPWAAAHALIRQVCKRCWTRDRKAGEKFCQPCGAAFLKSITGYLQPTGFCQHRRDPDKVVPAWDEGENPGWHNIEAAYEDDWEPERTHEGATP